MFNCVTINHRKFGRLIFKLGPYRVRPNQSGDHNFKLEQN